MNRNLGQWLRQTISAAIIAAALNLPSLSTGVSYANETAASLDGVALAQHLAVPAEPEMQPAELTNMPEPAPFAAVAPGEDFDEDPWEGFNEKMFSFNRDIFDRFVLKPIATGWDFIFPDPVQRGIHNVFDNLAVVRRVVNNTLQLKFAGAGTELARFTINSTIGLVGFFDVAKDAFGIDQRDEDTGQTFGVWGMGPGPYLVLPLLPPLTVRDGVGYALDAAMTPYVYFIPWWGNLAATSTNGVNERSLNLDRFERVAESTVDLYGAVRNAYLQRRAAAVKQ
jgi:phospholipid-binding lipoprotein MlaA